MEKPAFTANLARLEGEWIDNIVEEAIAEGLTREDFVEALEWFYDGESFQYEHIIDAWDIK